MAKNKRDDLAPNLIWQVHYMSSYYDDDPRMPGRVPVDERYFFVASSRNDALEKAYALKPKLKKLKEDDKLEVTALPLENLVAARDASNDGRLGFTSTKNLAKVVLSGESEYELYVGLRKK